MKATWASKNLTFARKMGWHYWHSLHTAVTAYSRLMLLSNVYAPLKKYYSTGCTSRMHRNPAVPMTIMNIAECFSDAYFQAFTPQERSVWLPCYRNLATEVHGKKLIHKKVVFACFSPITVANCNLTWESRDQFDFISKHPCQGTVWTRFIWLTPKYEVPGKGMMHKKVGFWHV